MNAAGGHLKAMRVKMKEKWQPRVAPFSEHPVGCLRRERNEQVQSGTARRGDGGGSEKEEELNERGKETGKRERRGKKEKRRRRETRRGKERVPWI